MNETLIFSGIGLALAMLGLKKPATAAARPFNANAATYRLDRLPGTLTGYAPTTQRPALGNPNLRNPIFDASSSSGSGGNDGGAPSGNYGGVAGQFGPSAENNRDGRAVSDIASMLGLNPLGGVIGIAQKAAELASRIGSMAGGGGSGLGSDGRGSDGTGPGHGGHGQGTGRGPSGRGGSSGNSGGGNSGGSNGGGNNGGSGPGGTSGNR